MSDEDFCLEHGRDFMRCDQGQIPYCKKCQDEQAEAMHKPAHLVEAELRERGLGAFWKY